MPEADWQQTVVDAALARRWLVYHTRDSRGSNKGFPDLVLLRPPRLVFLELKREKGKLSSEQEVWVEKLRLLEVEGRIRAEQMLAEGIPALPLIEVHVMRPSDWPRLEAILR